MTGASNKAFDYLACGLPVLVSDSRLARHVRRWRLHAALRSAEPQALPAPSAASSARPDLARSMGEKGRQRILVEWNYETCFNPVLRRMEGRTADAVTARAALEQLP